MAMTILEEKILGYIKNFGVLLEEQIVEMLVDVSEVKVSRVLNKLWKKDLIKWGGPDDAYIMLRSGSDNVDMRYVDCIWVMLSNVKYEEDITSAYKGKEIVKISYFSNEKQSNYNIVYINGEEDYHKIGYINSRFLDMIDDEMKETEKFIFVSEDAEVLEKMPLSKFAFPYIRVNITFSGNERYKRPKVKQI